MNIASERGFTLIELLVVIAIIGILASVILASLSSARNRSRDASIESNLHSVITQAELVRSASGCYAGSGGTCAPGNVSDTSAGGCGATALCSNLRVNTILKGLESAGGGALVTYQQSNNGLVYAYAAELVSDPTKAWCVDYTGASRVETIPGTINQAHLDQVITNHATCN